MNTPKPPRCLCTDDYPGFKPCPRAQGHEDQQTNVGGVTVGRGVAGGNRSFKNTLILSEGRFVGRRLQVGAVVRLEYAIAAGGVRYSVPLGPTRGTDAVWNSRRDQRTSARRLPGLALPKPTRYGTRVAVPARLQCLSNEGLRKQEHGYGRSTLPSASGGWIILQVLSQS